MKLATYNWNYRIIGRTQPISYVGVKTKREAEAFVDDWNSRHIDIKVEIIKYVNGVWVKA